jgi:hypothetical protein
VTPSDFVFTLRFAAADQLDGMLSEVASTVLRHVGCSPSSGTALISSLNALIRARVERGLDVHVQFRAHPGSCEIAVSVADREIWREKVATS